jgi:hypothetical protein
MMQPQQSDLIFNMGVYVMRPVFNLEPKYRVNKMTSEEWTRGPATPPVIKGVIWFTDGSRIKESTGAGVHWQSVGRRLSISLRKYATVFMLSCPVLIKFK